jgi:hypothetical protein
VIGTRAIENRLASEILILFSKIRQLAHALDYTGSFPALSALLLPSYLFSLLLLLT